MRARLGDLADVLAEIEDDRNVALAVEDAAGADRIPHALIDAIFQRNADVVGIGLEAADAHAADDVAGALDRLAAVGRGSHLRRKLVRIDDLQQDRLDHLEVVLADVGQRDLDVAQFRHAQNIGEQLLGETDTARADDGDLEAAHSNLLPQQT